MKKTSLVLAISALLYGTSWTYVLADAESDQIQDYLNNTPENAPYLDGTSGFDPAQNLPKNVSVVNDGAIYRKSLRMCDPSFTVNGPAMAEFPVTVNGSSVGVWMDNRTVKGTGWTLKLPIGDTWNSAWELTTEAGTVVTSILLEPFKRQDADKMKYAFDIGGKIPRAPLPNGDSLADHDHTPDSARGQFIIQRTPDEPSPIFTATYSGPVYTGDHGDTSDSIGIPFYSDDPNASRVPTHDLYSTLEINFEEGVADLLFDPGFKFVADTDCLPVEAVAINSYKDGILDFTVAGDGAVAIIKDGEQTGLRFEVSRDIDGGIKNFQIPFDPQPGSCYYMRDENTGDEMTETYCAPN
jgi:hypothetical protein